MPNVIRIKRRAAGGAAGAPASLATSELAYNEQDETLYIGFGDAGGGVASSIKSLAGPGSYVTLGSAQTISAIKTFSALPAISATLSSSDNSTNIATTAYVRAQNYLTANQTITLSGDASGSGTTAISVTITDSTVTGKLLTGYAVGTNTAIAATDSVLGAFQKIQGQINAISLGGLSTSTTSTQSGYFGDIFLFDDVTPSHYLGITNSANLTAARTLSINVNDGDRTLSLSGNLTVSSAATVSGTNSGDQTITLTGEVTGSGTGSFATTVTNSAVIGKVLTGYAVGTNTALAATDTILQAFQKLQGQDNARVQGPASATDNAVVRFDLATGKLVQDSTVTISDTGTLNIPTGQTYQVNGTTVLSGTALGTGVTGSSLTSVGTIGTGVWQGTAVGTAYGGTGATSALGGFNALSPLTTLGDLLTHNGTNNIRLAGNTTTTRQFLAQTGNGSVSASPAWTSFSTVALSELAVPTADVAFNSRKITGLADPTNAQDAATKAYVDAVKTGLDVKDSVRAASTANLASVTYSATGGTSTRGQITTAPNTLDGVSLAANNRILLKDQSTGAQNGIWVVSTLGTGANGVWDRATDFDADAEVTAGAFVFVEEGTTNADSGWVLTTNSPIVIGGASGTALSWAQFSGAGQITAGAGLTKTGNTLDVGQGSGITVNADSVQLAAQALAFHNLATTGLVTLTAANTVTGRTLTGTTNRVTITNGDGVSGNPTVDISSSYVGQSTITTLGTIGTGIWQGTAVGLQYGGTGANLSAASDGAIFKKSGTALVAATVGTDYLSDASTINGGTF